MCSEGLISNVQILSLAEVVDGLDQLPQYEDKYSIESIINDFVMAMRDLLDPGVVSEREGTDNDAEVAFALQWERYMTQHESFFQPEEAASIREALRVICLYFYEQAKDADIDLIGDQWYVIGLRAGRFIILGQATGLEIEEDEK